MSLWIIVAANVKTASSILHYLKILQPLLFLTYKYVSHVIQIMYGSGCYIYGVKVYIINFKHIGSHTNPIHDLKF
jgi:hypothetical protein